jgi:cell wall-associated NlpC family hydrolase
MKHILITLLLLTGFFTNAQDKKIDKLEILYDQQHYSKVYRKANALLADPTYDYSALPGYYKALSILRLANDEMWLKRHKKEIDDAINLYRLMLEHSNADDYLTSHYQEIAELKMYLIALENQTRAWGYQEESKKIHHFIEHELKRFKSYVNPNENQGIPNPNVSEKDLTNSSLSLRDKIVAYAKQFIGVKYVWAGCSPDGFDCSGFTSYVLNHFNISVSRTANGQLQGATKIKVTNAYKADLVFFGHSGKITHVGLLVSNKGEDLTMIHASTSKGIIITNIEKSTYWKPKLKGAARVV